MVSASSGAKSSSELTLIPDLFSFFFATSANKSSTASRASGLDRTMLL